MKCLHNGQECMNWVSARDTRPQQLLEMRATPLDGDDDSLENMANGLDLRRAPKTEIRCADGFVEMYNIVSGLVAPS